MNNGANVALESGPVIVPPAPDPLGTETYVHKVGSPGGNGNVTHPPRPASRMRANSEKESNLRERVVLLNRLLKS